jgi:hypothetical protein
METAHLTLPQLAPVVIVAAMRCIQVLGHGKKPAWAKSADFAVIGTVEIAYEGPNESPDTDCHLHVWKDRKTVLRATWPQGTVDMFKILQFRRGSWVEEVLRAAEFVACHGDV